LKQLLILLLTLVASCYGCKDKNKPLKPAPSPDFDKAEAFSSNNNKDSALYYFNEFVNKSNDSLKIAIAYNYIGQMQMEAGDYYSTEESLTTSLKHLDENDKNDFYYLFSAYTVLGNNYVNLKNFEQAIRCFDLAIKFAPDETFKIYTLNGKALAYQKKKDYTEAIKIYNIVLDKSQNSKTEFPRILSNIARAKWLRDPTYNAAPEFLKALHMRQQEKDNWGLNASYAHLSDYYSSTRPDSALWYAHKMYQTARLINSPDDRLESLQKLIKLSPAKDIKSYIEVYLPLNDSLQTARNNAKNQFALLLYGAEKSKADNLILQKDNAEKKGQIAQQQITLYIIIFIVAISVILTFNWYRKRKQRMQWESEKAIREERLRLSQRVHDVVANSLYSIITSLEHDPAVKIEQLADKLEVLYEKSRDISYEKPEVLIGSFQQSLASLLTSFASPSTKISIVGNSDDLWKSVNPKIKAELKHILQELLVNMKKHSQAQQVVVKFTQEVNQVAIQYTDDGIGLKPTFQYGNGLTNTENRIKSINGQVIFDKAGTKGLKIRISFPIA
jgi:signal transduction histidine kinase/Flp pilus assembly protein TadD